MNNEVLNGRLINMGDVIVWLIMYIAVCGILPEIFSRMLCGRFGTQASTWMGLSATVVLNIFFFSSLIKKYQIKLSVFNNITIKNILISLICTTLLFLLIEKFLDPIFDSAFVSSAETYQKNIAELRQYPVLMFLNVCLVAPIAEEILMRGCILGSLETRYNSFVAITFSTLFFALLHFNFVQTLSAVIWGVVVGVLYVKTGSLFCCILAHVVYNFFSYLSIIVTRL